MRARNQSIETVGSEDAAIDRGRTNDEATAAAAARSSLAAAAAAAARGWLPDCRGSAVSLIFNMSEDNNEFRYVASLG